MKLDYSKVFSRRALPASSEPALGHHIPVVSGRHRLRERFYLTPAIGIAHEEEIDWRFGKVVAEPCTIPIKVPNHNRVPTLAPLASQIDMGTRGRGLQGWDPRVHATHTVARLACPLGNAKDALDTIA